MTKRAVVLGPGAGPLCAPAGAEAVFLGLDQASAVPACDVLVLLGDPAAAGSGEELLRRGAGWVRAAAEAAARRSPGCVLIVAAPPVDALALVALRASRLPRGRVLGAAGLCASRRLERLLSRALGVSGEDVRAVALGGAGDACVALPRLCSAAGVPAAELLSPQALSCVAAQAREPQAPEELAAAAWELACAVLSGRRRLLPCSAYLEGEYGVDGVFLAVPAVLGAGGVERIVQLNLTVAERSALQRAASAGRGLRASLEVVA